MQIATARVRLIIGLVALASLPLAAQDSGGDTDRLQQELVQIEKSLWDAWQRQEKAPFEQYLHPDYVSIAEFGSTSGRESAIAAITQTACEVGGYSIGNWKALPLGGDTAILFYSASQNVTCDGEKLPSKLRCTSVYIRHDGGWRLASYQETRMK